MQSSASNISGKWAGKSGEAIGNVAACPSYRRIFFRERRI